MTRLFTCSRPRTGGWFPMRSIRCCRRCLWSPQSWSHGQPLQRGSAQLMMGRPCSAIRHSQPLVRTVVGSAHAWEIAELPSHARWQPAAARRQAGPNQGMGLSRRGFVEAALPARACTRPVESGLPNLASALSPRISSGLVGGLVDLVDGSCPRWSGALSTFWLAPSPRMSSYRSPRPPTVANRNPHSPMALASTMRATSSQRCWGSSHQKIPTSPVVPTSNTTIAATFHLWTRRYIRI